MASLNYYKPKFNWDSLDSELDRFKSECEVLFAGPLDESPANRQVGLVVNWLGSEAVLTLRSLDLTYDHTDTILMLCMMYLDQLVTEQCPNLNLKVSNKSRVPPLTLIWQS